MPPAAVRLGPLPRLASQPERFLNALLVTVTICQTAQAFLTSILAARLFGTVGVIVAFILNVIVFFVLAEAVPKTYAVLHPERAALISTPITAALVRFPPLQLISRALIGLTNVILPGKGLKQGPFVSEQELLGIVEAAAEDEVIEHEERELIESIIEFGDTVAREVMVPRPDMVLIPHDATVSGALDIAIEHGFSRLPVMGAGEDEVVGLGHAKDLMRAERDGRGDEPAAAVARPVRFVPENKPLNRLMREMQAEKFHLAIVLDEYGDIAGMVTLEDCLEELVGEIVDEFDREDREVVHLPDGTYVVDGGMSIGDLNDLLEIELPDEDWDTIAGFVFSTLGHVPVKGEAVESNGWRFAAEQLDGHRIRQRPGLGRTGPACGGGQQESRSRRSRGPQGARPWRRTGRRRAGRRRGHRLIPRAMRSGFVTLAGRPNVGKSTLLNALVGQKVSIVSDKPQTTRTQVRAIVNRPGLQLVFVDTPGIHKPVTALGERLNATAVDAFDDIDVYCLVLDATQPFGRGDRFVAARLPAERMVVVVSKIDVARLRPGAAPAGVSGRAGGVRLLPRLVGDGEGRARAARPPGRPGSRGPGLLPARRRERRARELVGGRAGAGAAAGGDARRAAVLDRHQGDGVGVAARAGRDRGRAGEPEGDGHRQGRLRAQGRGDRGAGRPPRGGVPRAARHRRQGLATASGPHRPPRLLTGPS